MTRINLDSEVYAILNRFPHPDAQVLRQAIQNLKTECEGERRERLRLDALRADLFFAGERLKDEVRGLRLEAEEMQAKKKKSLPDVEYARLDVMWQQMVLEIDELKRKLKTEEAFTHSYIRRLHGCEKERDEWRAVAERAIDASPEGAWMARAFDAERELAVRVKECEGLREFVIEDADNDCHYGDNCPSNAGTRHGTCRSCKARQTLAACGIHVWFEHDDLEACRNCGVVRREDDGNKPCKGKVALALR